MRPSQARIKNFPWWFQFLVTVILTYLSNLWTKHAWLIASICAFVLGLLLQRWWFARQRRSRGLRAKLGGDRAEKKARKLLQKRGYEIVESQPGFQAVLQVDGKDRRFEITPDYLVYRNGIYYAVEVKRNSGDAIARAANRRQVTEYLLATGMPCLLVNMTQREIQVIALSEDSFVTDPLEIS